KTLTNAIVRLGFECTMDEVIFPFMNRTGVLWATGAVNITQEHFISNLIRRKLSVAIDSTLSPVSTKAKRFALFLPESETHELLLLFTEFLLRARGHHVAYIGSSVPVGELEFLKQTFRPDVIVTYIIVPTHEMPIDEYLSQLSSIFATQKVIIGGAQITSLANPYANLCLVKSQEDLKQIIDSI
ncbi:MAG TPA: B12-binding domain-containing protein, partial [Chitinophagales bacterium]|nr:B12-binding domain-containing protein [Chitinophagales bacterium]